MSTGFPLFLQVSDAFFMLFPQDKNRPAFQEKNTKNLTCINKAVRTLYRARTAFCSINIPQNRKNLFNTDRGVAAKDSGKRRLEATHRRLPLR